ncbi:MAG: hypothetical protein ACOCV1_08105, partial [Bacillota bacterium]
KGLGKILLDESIDISHKELRWILGTLIDTMMDYSEVDVSENIDVLLEEFKDIKQNELKERD